MNAHKIRCFLLQQPKPSAVRVTTIEGDVQELSLGKGFKQCALSVEAIKPELIECLDKDGKLIRALRVSTADEKEQQQQDKAIVLPEGLAADPMALAFTHFAELLHRAYKDASSAAKHSTEVAFTKLVEIVERMGDRADSTEARLERVEAQHRRTVEQRLDDAWQQVDDAMEKSAEQGAAGGGISLEQLAGHFLQGMANRPPAAASNGAAKTNGASKPNGKAAS